jgi:hypothetical protein
MNWLKKLLAGRYGCDQLSAALLALSSLPIIIAKLSGQVQITCLTYLPLGVCIYRAMSKQVQKRRLENDQFILLLCRVNSFFQEMFGQIRELKDYKYFKCPNCGQKLRVPRGEGTVTVICSNCHTEIKKKT